MSLKALGLALGSRLTEESVVRGTLCAVLAGLGLIYLSAGQKENDASKMFRGAAFVILGLLLF